ncbi:MAG: hypothetical protein RLZZ628_3754 [Bacteroidota bacterium]|jgi:hypothetical protein
METVIEREDTEDTSVFSVNTDVSSVNTVNTEDTSETTSIVPMQNVSELMTIQTSEGTKDVTAFRNWIRNTHARCNGDEANQLLSARRNELEQYLSTLRPAKVILQFCKDYPAIVGPENNRIALRKLHMPLTRVQGSVTEWGEWNAA